MPSTPSGRPQPLLAGRRLIPALLLALLPIAGAAQAADPPVTVKTGAHTVRVVTVTRGLDRPWGMAFLPNGDMLITERRGRLRLYTKGRLQPAAIPGVPKVLARGQGGLLDIALHPEFARNRLVYLSYSGIGRGGAGTEVARARFTGSALQDLQVIFRVEPKTRGTLHYGSRLLFTPDGLLYITIGERSDYRDEAQNIANHLGTVIRLTDDGQVPQDNPFVGRTDARPEIYSYGHRNPQGMDYNAARGEVWIHEHGPRGGDEVNIVRPGRNYGWPAITYGIDYSGAVISEHTALPGMEQPVLHWTPSIAPSGMAFYTGTRFANWRGNLFVGALARRHLRRVVLQGDKVVAQEVLLRGLEERIRDVRMGPDGLLYLLTDDSDGRLIRLEPAD